MRDICILIHGVEADPSLRLWNEEVAVRYQHLTSICLIPRKYGYIGGVHVWFSAYKRREIVDHEESYFRGVPGLLGGLLDDINPDTKVSIVGHSLGGYITTALLKRGVKFHRIALLWSWTVEGFDWKSVEDNFNSIRVYWSPNDEKVSAGSVAVGEDPELTVGLMGKIGPQISHPRVESIKTDWTHTQFMDFGEQRDKFWSELFKWMEK